MSFPILQAAVASVPAGAWAVGVSGGADSVSLLALLRARADLRLHAVHLNHQTRGAETDEDAEFAAALARRFEIGHTSALRSDLEPTLSGLPSNPSARYRALRGELFRRVVNANGLRGVILAHHADDQAETVLHRLLRGSGPAGLAGMQPRAVVRGLTLLRPLLGVRRDTLRAYLVQMQQPWREDPSNRSAAYFRNRLRSLLAAQPGLSDDLLALADACGRLSRWVRTHAPNLEETFPAASLAALPQVLAIEAARSWLVARGTPPGDAAPEVIQRLLQMARDSASPPRASFPGGILIRRRGGTIFRQH